MRDERLARRRFYHLFPEQDTVWTGPATGVFQHGRGEIIYARAKYPKHLEHFDVGRTHRERCFMAANRVGKTVAGGFEDACHLTGLYLAWWTGRRFEHPIDAWIAGDTNETTRDILQKELFGPIAWDGNRKTVAGTGIIPGDLTEFLSQAE